MTHPLTLAHLSDTHLGQEAYHAVAANGLNARATDIVKAFHQIATHIAASPDIPLALHSGDVGERPSIPVRYMLAARTEFARMAAPLDAGSPYRRQVVVIAGNHDQPRSPKEPCWLELLSTVPGVHVVTGRYTTVAFEEEVAAGRAHPSLADVVVHALPHDELKLVDFDEVRPVAGKTNILMSHGVAVGSELFLRAQGREYPIPSDLLLREWDYVALGHYHKQGPVYLNGKARTSKIWYAGSPEHIDFGDVLDGGGKGYLRVGLEPGGAPRVQPVDLPIRPMYRLPVLDAAGMSPERIGQALAERVRQAGAEGKPVHGAVIQQVVINVKQDLWALVDRGQARRAAGAALHYDVVPRFEKPGRRDAGDDPATGDAGAGGATPLAHMTRALREASAEIEEDIRPRALDMAGNLLADALGVPALQAETARPPAETADQPPATPHAA
ncbi:metallophosphoesterase family protein [Bailinhaonella thermotolerans]|nr:metallophosphoesterase [Bailinhaonella thermotolerans]